MARKVFISVLGTGNYQECTYKKDGFESRTKFVQQAMLEYHQWCGVQWDENSHIYIMLTEGAKKQNWDVCCDRNGNVTNEQGLRKVLNDMGLKATINELCIDEGKNETELWNIFDTVFHIVEDGDELYFDLTHGFRYLPMFVLVFGKYVEFLKAATVKAITYGNYEMSEYGKKTAPIIDLLPLSALQDWTFAVANFKENGDVKKLLSLSRPELSRRLSESKGTDSAAKSLNAFMVQLDKFIDEVRLCRGVDTFNAKSFKRMMDLKPCDSDFIKPLNPILDNVLASLSDFSTISGAHNCFAAAKWCLTKGLYQQAVTELLEGIVTYFCQRFDITIDDHSKREIVNRAFRKKLTPESYKPSNDESIELKVDEIVDSGQLSNELLNSFSDLTDIRNDYNHAGMRNDKSYPKRKPRESNKMKAAIKNKVETLFPLFIEDIQPLPPLFVNLSNHPSAKWSKEQLTAAKEYGMVQDLPFPQVDPLASEEDIDALANESVTKILKQAQTHHVTVHVMGEMCLTFSIVKKLQAHGIECLSSTSYRVVGELPDGSKHIVFQFQRFRNYGK